MKIERSNLIENLVWYYINTLVFKSKINKDDLNQIANEVSFLLLQDGANDIPTKADVLIYINQTQEIDYFIIEKNKVDFNLNYWLQL
jgi:hypothetical protein